MEHFTRRTWLEIDLDAVRHNVAQIRSRIGGRKLMAIVKADAYGHGAAVLGPFLRRCGADCFGVSNIDEAQELRAGGVEEPILILGYTPEEDYGRLVECGAAQTLYDERAARSLSAAATAAGAKIPVHIKLDTGMNRLGFATQTEDERRAAVDVIERIVGLPGLVPEGIFTHFSVSDVRGNPFTGRQYDNFTAMLAALEQRGITFPLRHCDNSAAIYNLDENITNLVRPGIILYGLAPEPGDDVFAAEAQLMPAARFKSVVSHVKTVPAGDFVSYGNTVTLTRPTRVATIPVGYADGYDRLLSNRGEVLVNGRRCRILGRVCMDQMMVDATDAGEVAVGQSVTLFGTEQGASLSVNELAQMVGTISYELLCTVGRRVPRVYFQGGKVVKVVKYI